MALEWGWAINLGGEAPADSSQGHKALAIVVVRCHLEADNFARMVKVACITHLSTMVEAGACTMTGHLD
jgi:hypothetical protein